MTSPLSSRRDLLAALSASPMGARLASRPVGAPAPLPSYVADAVGAQPRDLAARLADLPLTPEDFGAEGDGSHDDAPAIQRALDAIAASGRTGVLLLGSGKTYRCRSGLKLDTVHASVHGQALLDFSGWAGPCLTVTATVNGEFGNSYGRRGAITGNVRIKGAGAGSNSIGVLFDSPVPAASARLYLEGVSIGGCGVGVRFLNRGYNNLFMGCEILNCTVCVEWPAGGQDNDERNTFVGSTFYNSDLAVRNDNPAGVIHLFGCSIDYTRRVYEMTKGKILAFACHHESDRWDDRPIRVTGDGGLLQLFGGWLLNQAKPWRARRIVEVGPGAAVHAQGLFAINLRPADPEGEPATWSTGPGRFHLRDTESFDLGAFPLRLHDSRSLIADPDFAAAGWEDTVWRIADERPLTTREGVEGDNLRLSKTRAGGRSALRVDKAYGTTSPSTFALLMVDVRTGDKILAGFRVERDSRRPGRDGTVHVTPAWAKADGHDADRIPVLAKTADIGTLTLKLGPGERSWATPMATLDHCAAPDWATHFILKVNLVQAHAASFLFDRLWCDRF